MKKFWQEWKIVFFLGFLILLIALGFRLYNLTILPVFADEAIYIRWSQVMSAEPTHRFLPLSDGKQPLFMWVLMFLVKRFSDPLFIGRLVSVGAGMGTLIGLFVLTYYLFKSKTVALAVSFIWAISPFSLFFDRMALVDSMLAMCGVWTLLWGVITAKTLRLDMAMFTGFALGAALLTKSPALFFVILLPSTWLLSPWPKKRKKVVLHLINLVCLSLTSYVIGYAMFNILRLGPNFHLLASRNRDYVFPLNHLWTNPKDPFIFYFHRAFEWLWIMGPAAVLILAVLGIVLNVKKYFKEVVLILAWFLVPIAIQAEFAKVFTARYILFSVPFVFVLAAISLRKIDLKSLFGKLVILVFIFFIVQALWFNQFLLTDPEHADLPRSERSGYLEEWTAGTGIREVAEIIKEVATSLPSGNQVVVGTEGYFGTLPDGLQMYLQGVSNVIVRGEGLGISKVPSSLQESKKAGNKTYLVANSSRLNFEGEFDDYGLKVIAAFPKAFRPEMVKERVAHGPRDTFYLFEVLDQ